MSNLMKKNNYLDKKLSAFSLVELSIVLLIIGILIAGITSASRLITEYRITTARTLSQSSAVPSISGLALWLDATAEEKLTISGGSTDIVDGNEVASWIDNSPQSVAGLTFEPTTALDGPIYTQDGINGIPTLAFDGNSASSSATGDCLSVAFDSSLNSGTFTIFAVVRPDVDVDDTENGTIIANLGSSNGFELNIADASATETFGFVTDTGSADETQSTGSISQSSKYIITARRTTTDSEIYLNGGSASSDTVAYANATSGSTFIGCSADEVDTFGGQISEIIVYSRDLKTEERTAVREYLGKKYAIDITS